MAMISPLFKYDTLNSMSSSSVPKYCLGTPFSNRRDSCRLVLFSKQWCSLFLSKLNPGVHQVEINKCLLCLTSS